MTDRDKLPKQRDRSAPEPEPRSERGKKRYAPPALVEYGPIGKLTRAGSATLGDASAMKMSCL